MADQVPQYALREEAATAQEYADDMEKGGETPTKEFDGRRYSSSSLDQR
jgi:hypothetical protein